MKFDKVGLWVDEALPVWELISTDSILFYVVNLL